MTLAELDQLQAEAVRAHIESDDPENDPAVRAAFDRLSKARAQAGYPCGCARGEGDPGWCQECHRQVAVVFDMEGDDAPMPLGLYLGTIEDVVRYMDAGRKVARQAPADCVKIVQVQV